MKEIKLNKGYVALVDDEDYDFLTQRKWYVYISKRNNAIYARDMKRKNGKQVREFMHRIILNVPRGMQTDHINHNGLDNRRSNLRICTAMQNGANRSSFGRSKYLGVSYLRNNNGREYIRAAIRNNGKSLYLGYYKTEEDAARAYDRAAKEIHGDFANLNFK